MSLREKPILMSAPMIRALLAGTKTQTRRLVKPGNLGPGGLPTQQPTPDWNAAYYGPGMWSDGLDFAAYCPYGQVGERLWAREAFRFPSSLDRLSPVAVGEKAIDAGYAAPWAPTQYEADSARTGTWSAFHTPPADTVPGKLRPGIHMPRWASRLTLEVTGVRVERLQDISEADAVAEGLRRTPDGFAWHVEDEMHRASDPRESYWSLWQAINGAGSVEANPWVWCVEFRRSA